MSPVFCDVERCARGIQINLTAVAGHYVPLAIL
jgi:hypothetical protein